MKAPSAPICTCGASPINPNLWRMSRDIQPAIILLCLLIGLPTIQCYNNPRLAHHFNGSGLHKKEWNQFRPETDFAKKKKEERALLEASHKSLFFFCDAGQLLKKKIKWQSQIKLCNGAWQYLRFLHGSSGYGYKIFFTPNGHSGGGDWNLEASEFNL